MCITAQCADPTELGVWWRDDAAWRLYKKESMRTILEALLKGHYSLKLELNPSAVHPHGASYDIDLLKMEQTNRASGHKRAIRLILPTSLSNECSFLTKGEHCVDAGFPVVARFQMHNSCVLSIRRGDITQWKVDGEADAVVNPCGVRGSNWLKGKERSFKLRANTGNTSIISPLESSNQIGKANGDVAAVLRHAAGPELQLGLQKNDNFATGAAGRCGDALINAGFGKGRTSFKSTTNTGNTSMISPLESSNQIGKANGGVAAALRRAAGPELQLALQKNDHFATGAADRCGDALITASFELPASHIIHAFAPAYQHRDGAACSFALLQRTYKSAISLAANNGLRYLAFPAISCGAGGFPMGFGAQAALEAVSASSVTSEVVLEIHFVLLHQKAFMEWTAQASKTFSKLP